MKVVNSLQITIINTTTCVVRCALRVVNDSQIICIYTKKAATCKKRIESLIQKIAEFKPSVPMTREEQQKVDNMLQVWSAQLHRQLSAVSIPVKPTYLRDTVTQILQSKGVNEPCTNRHLEWYLVRYNAKQLIPAEIADAIIQHRGSKWDSMPHLVRDAEYNINVADSNKSEGQKTRRKEENFLRIRDAFEFIESFPATPGIDTLDARLANDITVADMVLSWRKKSITRYDDYMTIFQMFVNSLQTLPDDARQVTFADTTEKATDPKKKGKANTKKSKAKSKKGKKENTSPTPPEQPSVEEDPGEEPENLTPEDFVHAEHSTDSAFPSELERQKNVHQNNHTELISYLKSIASRTFYLERNLTEGKNPEYIEKFASRADFRDLFNTLKQHTAEGTYAQAKTIMQFIRNVANYNILEWGAPAPGQ